MDLACRPGPWPQVPPSDTHGARERAVHCHQLGSHRPIAVVPLNAGHLAKLGGDATSRSTARAVGLSRQIVPRPAVPSLWKPRQRRRRLGHHTRARFHGSTVSPNRSLSVNHLQENSGQFVRPMTIAPARRRLAIDGLSSSAIRLVKPATPFVVGSPSGRC